MASQGELIDAVARKEKISPSTLIGVYGTESDYGKNPSTSSAGAKGPFQFLESTGKEYGLNSSSILEFQPSLEAAGAYLKSLGADMRPGSSKTIAALNAYNGNGGGASNTSYSQSVLEKGGASGQRENASFQKDLEKTLVEQVLPGGIGKAVEQTKEGEEAFGNEVLPKVDVSNPFGTIDEFIEAIINPNTWLRIAEGLGGLILIYLGLRNLTGSSAYGGAGKSVGQDVADVVALNSVAKPVVKHHKKVQSRRASQARIRIRREDRTHSTNERIRLVQKHEAARRATVRAKARK